MVMIPKIGILIPKLGIISILLPLLLVGCGTTTVIGYDGPCPLRPQLEPITVEQQIEISPHVIRIIADNQLKLKRHIKDLETLSGCTQE